MFNYGRYLLGSSARGTLPANLQGKWASGNANPWGAGTSVLLSSPFTRLASPLLTTDLPFLYSDFRKLCCPLSIWLF
jgi:hypothetical protein